MDRSLHDGHEQTFFSGNTLSTPAGEVQSAVQRRVGAQEAEDVMQDAYVRLLGHPDPSAIEDPRAYLYQVTANLCTNRFQREQARQRTFDGEGIDPDTLVSPLPQPDEIAEGVVQLEQFVSALDELPEACRDAFLLNRLEGLPYPEVARCLGVSPKTAQRYILKAWQHCLNAWVADKAPRACEKIVASEGRSVEAGGWRVETGLLKPQASSLKAPSRRAPPEREISSAADFLTSSRAGDQIGAAHGSYWTRATRGDLLP